jgi:hypothetical protein
MMDLLILTSIDTFLGLKSGIKGVRNFNENASLTMNFKTPLSNGLRK